MAAYMGKDKEKALFEALGSISKVLGKEIEYRAFVEYINWADKSGETPNVEEIARHTPTWVQLLSPPLRKLYDTAYNHGYDTANAARLNG